MFQSLNYRLVVLASISFILPHYLQVYIHLPLQSLPSSILCS